MAAVVEKLGLEGVLGFDGPSVEQPFLVKDEPSFAVAAALVESVLPAFVIVQGVTCVFQSYRFKELGGGCWEFFAKYGRREPNQTNAVTAQFDATGGTSHITQSIQTLQKKFDAGETVVYDFGGAIGVSNDGVEGTDIETPGYSFQYTIYLPIALWTPTYRLRLRKLSKKYNNAAWSSPEGDIFEAGEVRYRGFQASRRGFDDVELTHLFHAEDNRILTAGGITGITKRGQDYVWYRYAESDDTSGAPILKYPVAAYVEEVYHPGNFADLEP